VLHEAGLMAVRSEGRHRHYSVQKQALAKLIPWLEASWDDALYRLKLAAELERARRGPAPRATKHKRHTRPRRKGAH
jgi:hypothetical protein